MLVQASEMTRPSRPTTNSSAAPEGAADYNNYSDRPGAYIHSCRSNTCGTLGGRSVTGHWVLDRCFFPGQVLENNGRWHYVTTNDFSPQVSGWVHENWLLYTAPAGDRCWS
jgi:hypothetical protein